MTKPGEEESISKRMVKIVIEKLMFPIMTMLKLNLFILKPFLVIGNNQKARKVDISLTRQK